MILDSEASCYGLVVEILEALLEGMQDYTSDSRGDVGAWVREAAMLGLKVQIYYLIFYTTYKILFILSAVI